MTPLEKSALEKRWSDGWNPNEPIESFFDRLEDCYVMAITQPPAYTSEQMIDKAVTAIQTTGLFPTAILDWNGFIEVFGQSSNPISRKRTSYSYNPEDSTGTTRIMEQRTRSRMEMTASKKSTSPSPTFISHIMRTPRRQARRWQHYELKWRQPDRQW